MRTTLKPTPRRTAHARELNLLLWIDIAVIAGLVFLLVVLKSV